MKPLFIERNIVGRIVWTLLKAAFVVALSLLFVLIVHTFLISAFGTTGIYYKIIESLKSALESVLK